MAGEGAPNIRPDGTGLNIVVVASQWHTTIMDALVAGAERALTAAGANYRVVRVPGAFELPVVAAAAARSGVDAVVALGVVIQGETPHFEYVCQAATVGLTNVAVETGVPVGVGVLTTDDEAQALARAGLPDSREDKGAEAADAAMATVHVLREVTTGAATEAGFRA